MNSKRNRRGTYRRHCWTIGSAAATLIALALGGCGHAGDKWVEQNLERFEKAFDESLIIYTTELPAAMVGKKYDFTLNARGKPKPFRWGIVSGQLPDGMQLADDGALFGTPAAAQVARFVVKVACKSQPQLSAHGGLPHVGWRMRQFTLVVKDVGVSSPGRPASAPKTDSARSQE
jgi:hypothetical protein